MAWIRSSAVAEGILVGSPRLEQEFVERFLPRLQAFFRARVSNPDVQEELTQETLVAVLLALRAGKLRDASAMDGFVVGVARNQLAESLRVQAKHLPTVTREEIERTSCAPGLDPETRLTVQNELRDLAAMDQRILWLILIEGFRPAEVAPQVGLSEEAVRQRKSRSLSRLHKRLFGSSVTKPSFATTIPQADTAI